MKILVLSDSHSGLSFMRFCMQQVRPDQVIHLGDYFEDGKTLAEEYPHIRFHQVPGNCDRLNMTQTAPDILCYPIGGAMLFMTHGHRHGVKSNVCAVIADAKTRGAQAVLFGHTHAQVCYFDEENGLWVLNPGSCSSWSGSAGIVEIANGSISACRILCQADMEIMQVRE